MSLVSHLESDHEQIWENFQTHPFVEAIGSGELDEDKFKHYLIQDYLFLIDYCRVLSIGIRKADKLDDMEFMSTITESTLHEEMELHREFCEDWGIGRAELEEAEPVPTTLGYTRFMLGKAEQGNFLDVCCVLAPCFLGYTECGVRLEQEVQPGPDHPYKGWIDTYSDPDFVELAEEFKKLTDRVAEEHCVVRKNGTVRAQSERYRQLSEIFREAVRWEWQFWQMGWEKEEWPGELTR